MKNPLGILKNAAMTVALLSAVLSLAGLDYNHLFAYSMANNLLLGILLGTLEHYQESGEKKWLYATAFWGAVLILWLLLAGVVQRFRA